jgi:hypothetical protein
LEIKKAGVGHPAVQCKEVLVSRATLLACAESRIIVCMSRDLKSHDR